MNIVIVQGQYILFIRMYWPIQYKYIQSNVLGCEYKYIVFAYPAHNQGN
jgi:hypothetical protein